VDSLARFVAEPVFSVTSDQDVADLVAFLLAFSGGDLPVGSLQSSLEALGPRGQDAHAAVGVQATVASPGPDALADALLALSVSGAVDLVVKGRVGGVPRGWVHRRGSAVFDSDVDGESISPALLRATAAPGSELTYTAVPLGLGTRLGVDRDEDGFGDRTEELAGSDPTDPLSRP
jgi:hypothetical protein